MPQQKIGSNELEFSSGVFPITGAISVSAGSNTAPGFTTAGDTNTGMFFPTADTIAFSEGGVESMRIDSSGNMGIGTVSPAGVGKLAVKTSSTSTSAGLAVISSANDSFLTIYNSGSVHSIGATYSSTGSYQPIAFLTSDLERMRISSGGFVGIGTNNPGYRLEVVGTLGVESTGNNVIAGLATLFEESANRTRRNRLEIGGDASGQFINATWSSGGTTAMRFQTDGTERMRITSGGNVGIGVTDPVSPLTVKIASGSSVFPVPSQTAIGGGSSGRLNLIAQEPGLMINTDMNFATGTQTGTGTASLGLQIGLFGANDVRCMMFWAGSPAPLVFANASTPTGTIVERMRIDSSGRVTAPFQPAFFGYASATTNADIVYGNTYVNIGGHLNTSTGIFTAPVAGTYFFTAHGLANGGSADLYLKINNVTRVAARGNQTTASISGMFTLSAGDTARVSAGNQIYGDSAGWSAFSGRLVQ